jgi:predicted XRE-type DNA-binding protein
MSKRTDHSGSTFDSFLQEEGLLSAVDAVALKRVLAWQLKNAMKTQGLTKQRMAEQMNTSRSQIDRLLDPEYTGIALDAVSRAAQIVGKRVSIQLVDVRARQAPSRKVRARRAASTKRTLDAAAG